MGQSLLETTFPLFHLLCVFCVSRVEKFPLNKFCRQSTFHAYMSCLALLGTTVWGNDSSKKPRWCSKGYLKQLRLFCTFCISHLLFITGLEGFALCARFGRESVLNFLFFSFMFLVLFPVAVAGVEILLRRAGPASHRLPLLRTMRQNLFDLARL